MNEWMLKLIRRLNNHVFPSATQAETFQPTEQCKQRFWHVQFSWKCNSILCSCSVHPSIEAYKYIVECCDGIISRILLLQQRDDSWFSGGTIMNWISSRKFQSMGVGMCVEWNHCNIIATYRRRVELISELSWENGEIIFINFRSQCQCIIPFPCQLLLKLSYRFTAISLAKVQNTWLRVSWEAMPEWESAQIAISYRFFNILFFLSQLKRRCSRRNIVCVRRWKEDAEQENKKC